MDFAACFGASLVAGLAATAWTALTLAAFGRYAALGPVLAFAAAAVPVFVALWRRRGRSGRHAVAVPDVIAACIAAATLLLTIPPDEIIVGGQDPGVYVHTAAVVARTGSLMVDAQDLAALPAAEQGLLFRWLGEVGMPFHGTFLLPDGRLSLQFYHLYPCLMAVAWSLGGLRGALLVNPLLNVAAILALYAVAALVLGRRWALAAALVHALASAQIRQAKFPTSEMLTQFFLLAGVALLAAALGGEDRPKLLGPLAGVSFGMAMLTRYDTLLFLLPLTMVLLAGMDRAGRTRPVLLALGTTALLGLQAWLHQRMRSPLYQPLGGVVGWVLAVAAAVVLAAMLLRRTGAWRRLAGRVAGRETALRAAGAAILVGWVLFGWFVRPRLAGDGPTAQLFHRIAGHPSVAGLARLLSGAESVDMLYLADLLGALGLLAAVAGVAVLLVSRRQLWESAWLAASVAVFVVFTVNVFHDHFLMWVSRRFIPVVLPLASVGIAAAAAGVANAGRRRSRALAGAGIALVAAVLWLNAGATSAMAREREWPGLIAWYEQFEKAVPAGADIYCDQPGFAAPLRFISGRRAYELSSPNPERVRLLLPLMRRKAAAGREVLYLSQETFADPGAQGLVPLGSYPLRSTMLANTRRGVPTGTKPRGADFVLYRVQPS